MRRLLILILALLLLTSAAFAGAAERRITLKDGAVLQGEVVERGEHHLVLKTGEGTQIEVFLEQIQSIEVLGEIAPPPPPRDTYLYDEDAARSDAYDIPQTGEWDEDVEPEVSLKLDALKRRELKLLRSRLEQGHALAVAPTIPTMITGMVMMALAPVSGDSGAYALFFGFGSSMVGGSVVSAAVGADLANQLLGRTAPTPAYRVGLGFSLSGSAIYSMTLGLTHASWNGLIPSDGIFAYTGLPVLLGSSVGLLIAGNTILMADAKNSVNVVSDRVRSNRRSERGAFRPTLASAWVTPGLEGGVNAGFALSF